MPPKPTLDIDMAGFRHMQPDDKRPDKAVKMANIYRTISSATRLKQQLADTKGLFQR